MFSLGAWSPLFPAGFHVSCGTQVFHPRLGCSGTGLSPFLVGLPRPFPFRLHDCCGTLQPRLAPVWALPLSLATTRGIVSFPRATEMFQFTRFPSPCGDNRASPLLGFPIRTSPAVCGCTRLTGAFRSVPRPSSARRAQASPVCSYSLLEPCDTEKLILSFVVRLAFSRVFFGC